MRRNDLTVITIDGPASAGKGTMARHLASNLAGFAHLDTGAVYRTIAYALIEADFTPRDLTSSRAACIECAANCGVNIVFQPIGSNQFRQVMRLGKTCLPDTSLRTPEISEMSSVCAADPMVRITANHAIREAAEDRNLIIDGRDCGTVLFPDADLKFYLWAPAQDRALWRQRQNLTNGIHTQGFDQVLADIKTRDDREASRKHDPLKIPDGAIWIDAGALLEDSVKKLLLGIAQARLNPDVMPIK